MTRISSIYWELTFHSTTITTNGNYLLKNCLLLYLSIYNLNHFKFFKILKVFINRPLLKNKLHPGINYLSLILIGTQMIKITTKMIDCKMIINKMNLYYSIKHNIFARNRAFLSTIIIHTNQHQYFSIKIKIIYQAN